MSRYVLCTVGTSLLTNLDRPWAGWKPGEALPDQKNVLEWLRAAGHEKATAETNTLLALDLQEGDHLELIHSATPEGRFCAELLGELYKPHLRSVRVQEVRDLGYGAEAFTRGLKGLVDLAIASVRRARDQGLTPVFSATGGFKAEIAFLNLLGALLHVEVVYIHEQFRNLVRFPRLPLRWDDDFVMQHEDFFAWIDQEPRRTAEVESWLKARPELHDLVEEDTRGYVFLSAAGNLLYRAAKERSLAEPRATWPAADPRPPNQKNHLSDVAHRRPPGADDLVRRLCRVDCVSSVRYDAAAKGRPPVRVIDPDRGAISVVFGPAGNVLPLRVETTARGQAQCELVADHLRRLVR
jgi:putative CRISPR-associated protein (TIGR02619 family)